jgi:bifunctional DNA-binding transcriptional regulator/antitoxin component of YhaV-PrlF toxin-antitoxin module
MVVFSPSEEELPLPTIQLHYDGWLALPAEARQHLNIATGDRLDIELTEAGLLLRSARRIKEIIAPEPQAVVAQPAAAPVEPPEAVEAETTVANRGQGRPRKVVTLDLAPSVKVGGRRKSPPPLPN